MLRWATACAFVLGCSLPACADELQPASVHVERPRLYVLDCGTIRIGDTTRFGLQKEEVRTAELAVPCFLVLHPRGSLMWDAGWIPEPPDPRVAAPEPLVSQFSRIGVSPGHVTYLALSHYHNDHTSHANAFAGSTWLVRRAERDAMFAPQPPRITRPASYASLRESKTILIDEERYDVFGDGSVVILSAPGHTPGHQLLLVRLAETGNIVLSGDLYHYPEQRTLGRMSSFEADPVATKASREALETVLREADAELWIQHDMNAYRRLRKAPEYYE